MPTGKCVTVSDTLMLEETLVVYLTPMRLGEVVKPEAF